MPLGSKLASPFISAYIFTWDILLALLNLVLPAKKIGRVVPPGHPGFGGDWPEYVAPKDGDSRCSCPALNAMANHGILPHDGKNIPFKDLTRLIRTTYNFAPTFCLFVPRFAASYLQRSYSSSTFSLHEIDLHTKEGIEHDASLARRDVYWEKNQAKVDKDMVERLLGEATGKDPKDGEAILTPADLSRFSSIRRAESRRDNPEFSLDCGHKMFGSSNASTMLVIFGGRVSDLRTWLLEERLPMGWEPRLRSPFGLTFAAFNLTVFKVERGINDERVFKEMEAKDREGEQTQVV